MKLDVTVLAPRILSWLLDFSKIFGTLPSIVTYWCCDSCKSGYSRNVAKPEETLEAVR